ncbi:MAG: carbamate kinase [Thermoplasmataceae archaeon]
MVKIVIAFGGNALLETTDKRDYGTQVIRAYRAFYNISEIISMEDVVITHGNGPQVGDILLRNQISDGLPPPMPLDSCGAMSQGLIGQIMLEAYEKVRSEKGISKEAVVTVTRSIVDPADKAFLEPTKPVGAVFSDEKAKAKMDIDGWKMVKTEKGWRRVVPSPMPLEIVERNAILSQLRSGFLPICTGGGGIPVIRKDKTLTGVEAVIDKDLASSVLASSIEADKLAILTDVKNVYINYGKSDQAALSKLSINEAKEYLEKGFFGKGSMEPKVKAAIRFIEKGGKEAVIGNLSDALNVLEGKSGTAFTRS